jgi:transcriptional regulator with XRE-family HTH domain
MNRLGDKIAEKRKIQGMTQIEFAEKMHVTRQTVSRWEAGTAMPDIEKIGEIADILGVSCDYLLKDDVSESKAAQITGVGKLLKSLTGKTVQLSFFDEEADIDLFNTPCRIMEFEGNWMRVSANTKKGTIEKLIPISSVLSIELVKEDQ